MFGEIINIREVYMKAVVIALGLVMFGSTLYAHSELHECCTLDQRIDVASVEPTVQSVSGKSTAVLDSYFIEEMKPLKLIDSIVNVPGVVTKDITGLGSVRIRGARSFDTKYLYDGFPLKDPSHPQGSWGSFFGDTISFGNSEIQFLKGAGSVLYSSEAMGGVVGIEPLPITGVTSTTEYGSRESLLQSFDSEVASVSYADSVDSETINVRLSKQLDTVMPFFIYQSTDAPLHNAPFTGTVLTHNVKDENDRRETWYWQSGVKVEKEPVSAKLSYSDASRRFVFLPNSDGTGFYSDGFFNGQVVFGDFNVKVLDTILGYSYQRDFMEIETSPDSDTSDLYQNDVYIERKFDTEKLHVNLGSRYALHEKAKDRLVYDASAAYHFPYEVIGRVHYGTSFRSPSLYELGGAFLTSFGRFEIGNTDLSPERGGSFDIGLEKTFDQKVTVGTTFFQHELQNRIDFVGMSYANVPGDLTTYGYEAFYEQFLFGFASLRLSYTRTIQPGLIDISPNMYEATFRIDRKKWKLFTGISYRDEHSINLFNMSTFMVDKVTEDSRWTTQATLTYVINDNVSIYGRVENVLDEVYYDGGYKKDGFSAYAGVKISI